MPPVTIWTHEEVRCVVRTGGRTTLEGRLLRGDDLIRETRADSAEQALALAALWQAEHPGDRGTPRAHPKRRPAPTSTPRAPCVRARVAPAVRETPTRVPTFAVPRTMYIDLRRG